jgi:2'-5' RNA ligase
MSAAARDSHRLFFSLWPSAEFRAQVETTTRAAVRRSGGRIIPSQNFHVTLLFLGEVLRSSVAAVQQAAAAIDGVDAFEFSFDRIEAWPGSRVLCLAPSAPPPAAARLAKELQVRLEAQGFRFRPQEFRPHMTLARDLPRIQATETVEPLPLPMPWKVDEFVLMQSQSGGNGTKYSVLDRWPLAAVTPSTS